MSVHFLIMSIYLVAAAAGGAAAYRLFQAPVFESALLAGLVLFVAVMTHAILFVGFRTRRISRRQDNLEVMVDAQENALSRAREDLEGFKVEVAEAREAHHEKLMAEVKVLQTLLAQVVSQKRGVMQHHAHRLTDEGEDAADAAFDPEQFSEAEILAVMQNALEENRVDLYLQPIVQLPSRKAWHYECLSRVRDAEDHVIYPSAYIEIAERQGMAGPLDNLLLFRCIQMLRQLGHRRPGVKFFCNISSASLRDQQFFPPFVDFMLDNKSLADRLIFEFSYQDLLHFPVSVVEELQRLSNAGFGFSVDQLDSLNFDAALLGRRRISYAKVDAALLLKGESDIHAADLKTVLQRYDIALIATKIEDEHTVVDILDFNIDYGQGFLFGEPRPSRLLDEAAA